MLNPVSLKQNVDLITLGEKSIYLVGTAHISESSAELVEEVIRDVKPDTVAVELCQSRYQSLRDPNRWKNTDIVAVIRQGKAYVLLAQLILAGFQKKIGKKLNIKPGAEMLRACALADELKIFTVLADRDVRITFKRVWASLGFWSMVKVLGSMVSALFSSKEISKEEIERLKSADALEELMREFSATLPEVRTTLIDERDKYLTAKIQSAPGKTVVAVVGAGHISGIKSLLGTDINVAELEVIPPKGLITRIIGWSLPVLVIGMIIYGFVGAGGAATSTEMIESWVIINGAFAAFGAALILPHPLTVLSAFVSAPFTVINPFIASGWVSGLVEAMIRKPRVGDLETVADDISTFKGLWHNRVTRILLVVASTNLFGSVGAIFGIGKLASFL